ncbi:uncharacterized protein LOC142632713 [Castanea sativa]|uniref:uncharacterized protein LOC142632713 n=1 Tax=Castanea sativa TaxID=21020 RepID=UPI003F653736
MRLHEGLPTIQGLELGYRMEREIPWFCVGDFNEITKQDEKVGGAIRRHNQMQSFREVIDKCGFMHLGYIDPKYTWCRHYENGNSIWEQLDKGLATNSWFLKFLGSMVHHLQCDLSNHCPLLINLSRLDPLLYKKLFWFEEMWLSNSNCEEVVQLVWNSTDDSDLGRAALEKMSRCGRDLTWWNKNVFGNVRQELKKMKE